LENEVVAGKTFAVGTTGHLEQALTTIGGKRSSGHFDSGGMVVVGLEGRGKEEGKDDK